MSKAKTAGEKATASAESALETGTAALKTGLEKALKSYDAALGYSKDTAEAVMKSATVAGKGVETINGEIYAYSKQSIEDTAAAAKAVMGSSRCTRRSSSRPTSPNRLSKLMSPSFPSSAS